MSFILFLSASIGVIDGGMGSMPKLNNVEINIVDNDKGPLAKSDSGRSHAADVIYMISQGYKPTKTDKLTVYYSTPFSYIKTKDSHEMSVDWVKMENLLQTFKDAGVVYVCTTFVTTDKKNSIEFMNKAKELGLVVVTSLGNNEIKTPYPAMLPDTISVLDTNIINPVLKKKATHTINGEVKIGTKIVTSGSSFAAAKITGQLAND